jgi:hypothetical protein
VPVLDFLVIGDHVRPESAGVLNILGAGIDRVMTDLPGAVEIGVAGRIVLTPDEFGEPHTLDIRVLGPTDVPILQVRGELGRAQALNLDGLPDDWPLQTVIATNLVVPIQEYGQYRIVLSLDGTDLKTVRILAVPLQEA